MKYIKVQGRGANYDDYLDMLVNLEMVETMYIEKRESVLNPYCVFIETNEAKYLYQSCKDYESAQAAFDDLLKEISEA